MGSARPLTATARGLKSSHVRFARAGSQRLRLHLSRAGRRVLADSRSARLPMLVVFSFQPSDGAPASVIREIVTFRQTS